MIATGDLILPKGSQINASEMDPHQEVCYQVDPDTGIKITTEILKQWEIICPKIMKSLYGDSEDSKDYLINPEEYKETVVEGYKAPKYVHKILDIIKNDNMYNKKQAEWSYKAVYSQVELTAFDGGEQRYQTWRLSMRKFLCQYNLCEK